MLGAVTQLCLQKLIASKGGKADAPWGVTCPGHQNSFSAEPDAEWPLVALGRFAGLGPHSDNAPKQLELGLGARWAVEEEEVPWLII